MYENVNFITVLRGYPSDVYMDRNTFAHVLMREFLALGVSPTVIAPEELYILTRYPWLLRR